MGDVRDYDWAFPLIGGIIALIAFLTPAGFVSYIDGAFYVWMWGLFSIQAYGYGSVTRFTQDIGEIFVSLIGSLIVLISIVNIISKGYKTKKSGDSTVRAYSKAWVAPSIWLMVGTIIWIVGLEINSQVFFDLSMWAVLRPGFGVIGMFLGGVLSLIGYGVSKMSPKQPSEVIVPMKEEFMRPEQGFTAPSQVATDLTQSSINFCTNCGEKIIDQKQQFCGNCGFELRSVPKTQFP